MAAELHSIACPLCGTPMNHHADKLLYASETEELAGELVEQLHRCPACGAGDSRLATLAGDPI